MGKVERQDMIEYLMSMDNIWSFLTLVACGLLTMPWGAYFMIKIVEQDGQPPSSAFKKRKK